MNKSILFVLLIVLIGGCSTHRKLQRSSQVTTSDTGTHHSATILASRSDSLDAAIRKQVSERSETGTMTIERGTRDPQNDPFNITAAFKIDTTATGDTLRLVSQENDQVNFQVYYDKKSGQAVAQIKGKGGKVATPFEKITITNATVTKNTDSAATVRAHSNSSFAATASDSASGHHESATTSEASDLIRKQTGIKNIAWGIVALVAGVIVLLFLWKRYIA